MFLLILVVVCYTICSLSDKYAVSTAKFNGDELGFLMAAATAVFMACCLPFLDRTITFSWQSFAAIGLLCLSKIDHPQMSISDRAAQFSPFAALTGYDAAVDETARYTEIREELTEDEVNKLNDDLNRLLDMLDERPEIRVTYFVPDKKKSGGSYQTKTGIVRIYDSYTNELVFMDKTRIAVEDMCLVEFVEERGKIQ